MAKSRVSVSLELFTWARERAGLTTEEVARRFPKFTQWASGELQPTVRQLEDFARATSTPFGYFFLQHPPEERLPIPDLRTVGNQPVRRPSANLLETVHTLVQRQIWMREFRISEGDGELDFIRAATLNNAPEWVAASMRNVLRTGIGWAQEHPTWSQALRALRRAIENAGVVVVSNGVVGNNTHRKLDPNEFRGFALVDEYAPFIFVNAADGRAAQMFTLAHELAHLWIGASGVSDLPNFAPENDIERFCNFVAAEYLVPREALDEVWPNIRGRAERFELLARQFKVSTLVAAIRTQQLGLITRQQFQQFYQAYEADERRRIATKSSGGDFYNTQDSRIGRPFAQAVARAVYEEKILYRHAYELTGLRGATFERYFAAMGLPEGAAK
jgi:Zn-dependent peptidase ImmA (M78 family)